MKTYRFYNRPCPITGDSNWYIDLKFFPFNKEWLKMVAGADTLLDMLAEGNKEIYLDVDTYPIPFSDGYLEKHFSSGWKYGAIYFSREGFIKRGVSTIDSVWLCPATLWVFWRYPRKIYYKISKKK